MQENTYLEIRVKKSQHTTCGKNFFEAEGKEISACPHCLVDLTQETVEELLVEEIGEIEIDSKTGEVIR